MWDSFSSKFAREIYLAYITIFQHASSIFQQTVGIDKRQNKYSKERPTWAGMTNDLVSILPEFRSSVENLIIERLTD